MTIVFETPDLTAQPTAARRGRPEIFNDEFRAALHANPGEFAVLQENVKGKSRVSALRKRHAGEGFEFLPVVTSVGTRTNRNGQTVKDETVKIYVRYVAPEVEAVAVDTEPEPESVETPTEVVSHLTPEEQAQADAEFEAATPAPARKRGSRAKA